MYIIVNKATFIVAKTIMVIIKNSIKLINTTSLSDSKAIKCSGNTYLLQCSFPISASITYNLQQINIKRTNFRFFIVKVI